MLRCFAVPRNLISNVSLLLITLLSAGCAGLGLGSGDRADPVPGEVTPTTRGVYVSNSNLHVRLEPQDQSQGAVAPNDHPADVSAAQVQGWLEGLKVRTEEGGDPIRLVSSKQLPKLSVIVAQALGDAGPNQDVVFHTFGKAGSWFGSERRVTTARVFYQDDALNLVFGNLDDFYSEHIDRSLQPLKPGSRSSPSDVSGELVDSPAFAFVDSRDDWIRIDAAALAVAADSNTAQPAASSQPTAAPAPVPTTQQAGQTSTDPRWNQLEERLLILEGLRRKGLITDEDFETKKQELLEVLDL